MFTTDSEDPLKYKPWKYKLITYALEMLQMIILVSIAIDTIKYMNLKIPMVDTKC